MTAPERIWATINGIQPSGGAAGLWRSDTPCGGELYVRAALAAVSVQVEPDCCDICRGKTFAETADGKGWRCVECKAIWLRETQPDPRDEVIARLVEAADVTLHDIDDLVANSAGVAGLHMNGDVAEWETLLDGGAFGSWLASVEKLRAALAAAKAV